MLNVKALKTFDQKNKTVLIRFDLNIPLNKEASTISDRITRIKNPIQNLLNKNNKVVILSHLGSPKGKRNDELSLNQIISSLENILQKKIIFLSNCIGDEIEKKINSLSQDSIILLENCRFHEGEEQNDKFFASELSKLADVYINDAFACSHRAHASIEAITNFIPSYCGELLHEEILNLNDVVNNPKTPALTIIGGSKISTKITVIKNLLQKMDSIVIAGGMANNFLKYLGNDVKNSLIENDVDHLVKEIINFANEQNCKLILPLDVVTAEKVSETTEINECAVDAVKDNQMILDIGKQTIELIKNEISNCETVFWNGPVGVFETKPFHKGTFEIAKFIAEITDKNSLRSFAGGGDTISALDMAAVKDKFSYVSTGGGALLELIEGKKLPGLVALGAL